MKRRSDSPDKSTLPCKTRGLDKPVDDKSLVDDEGLISEPTPSSKGDHSASTSASNIPMASAPASGNDNSASAIPYILDGEFFTITSRRHDKKVTAKCNICVTNKVISGNLTSTGNFLSHIKHVHPTLLSRLEAKRSDVKNKTKTTKPPNNPRKGQGSSSNQSNFFFKRKSLGSTRPTGTVTQEEAMASIVDFCCGEMLPLSTIEKPKFRKMCDVLSTGTIEPLKMPNKTSFLALLKERKETLIYSLKTSFKKTDYVCTTADLWSANNKSYMGMTAHLIDKDTLERKSYVLACKRFRFKHSFDKIAEVIFRVHEDFGIVHKVTHTVTDNATNFGKAFRLYGSEEKQNGGDTGAVGNGLREEDVVLREGEEEGGEEVVPVDLDKVFCEDWDTDAASEFFLPSHVKCSSHTLNLIATTDVSKIKDTSYRKIHDSSFEKCDAIWNTISRSTKAADSAESILKVKLPVPNKTRWSSKSRSVKKLNSIKHLLPALCDELQLPKLNPRELTFLQEYELVTGHVADALDILQSETNKMAYYGVMIPTLIVLRTNVKSCVGLIHCEPLRQCILSSLTKRFGELVEPSPSSVMMNVNRKPFLATLSHPRFKLNGVPESVRDACRTMFIAECEDMERLLAARKSVTFQNAESNSEAVSSSSSSSKDYFAMLDPPSDSVSQQQSIATIEALKYLGDDSNDESKTLDRLHSYPVVKEVFLKYNTTMTSSAPVERVFCTGGQILTPRRNRLSDENFELLMLLKGNEDIKD